MNDTATIDSDIIPPSIGPATNKIAIRHVKATNAAGTRTKIQVRDFDPVFTYAIMTTTATHLFAENDL